MALELEQKVSTGHGPFDQEDEESQKLSNDFLNTDPEDRSIDLGREEDEHRERSVPDYSDTF